MSTELWAEGPHHIGTPTVVKTSTGDAEQMSDEIPEARVARDEVRKNFKKPFYLSELEFSDPVLIAIETACRDHAERVTADLRAKLADADRDIALNAIERKLHNVHQQKWLKEKIEAEDERDAAIARAEAAERDAEDARLLMSPTTTVDPSKTLRKLADAMLVSRHKIMRERDELRREVAALKANNNNPPQ